MPNQQETMLLLNALLVLATTTLVIVNYILLRRRFDPSVVVYLSHDADRPTLLTIVIENIGESPAYNVTFDLPQDFPTAAWANSEDAVKDEYPVMDDGPLITGIKMLGPGDRRVINWGQFYGLRAALDGPRAKVISRYEGRSGLFWSSDHETESWLDVESYGHTNAAGSVEHKKKKALEEIADGVSTIADAIEGTF